MRRFIPLLACVLSVAALATPRGAAAWPPECTPRVAELITTPGAMPRDSLSSPTGPSSFAYDWTIGYASFSGRGYLLGCDTLTLAGLPDGTPVDLRVRLRMWADIDTNSVGTSGFDFEVWFPTTMEALYHSWVVNPGDPPYHVDDVQEVVIHRVAGEPFPMRWWINGGGAVGHVVRARGIWEYLDLPEGTTLLSRAGYGAATTPARASTWGRIKVLGR